MDLRSCLEAHNVVVASDSEYQSRARLLQALWRVRKGLPSGEHNGAPLGSRLPMPMARETLANFLTGAARETVLLEVEGAAASGKLYGQPRIFNDLLSSQPMCFNLFSDMKANRALATAVFSRLHPSVQAVTGITFEYSPGRRDPAFTGDRSAFDVFVEYDGAKGKGFLGIEVKYHEALGDKPAEHRARYDELATAMGVFRSPDEPSLRRAPLQQIWRDHLLAGSLLLAKLSPYKEGTFVFLYPKENHHCRSAVEAYRVQLAHGAGEPTFREWHLEDVVAALKAAEAGPWVDEFHGRYLDFDAVKPAGVAP